MKYKFTTTPYKQKNIKMYGVDILDNSIESLRQISWQGWTSEEIQKIIDKSKSLRGDQDYKYQVPGSDLLINIYPDEVYFFDYRTEQEEEDFSWTFEEFINFMEKFKEFVKDNS